MCKNKSTYNQLLFVVAEDNGYLYKSMVKYRWFIFDESKEGKYGTEKKYLFKIA